MSRGGSYGGGQSSLGYLFGSDEQPSEPPVSPTIQLPPYGIDTIPEKPPNRPPPAEKQSSSNNYQRTQGQNTGNFITVSCSQTREANDQNSIALYHMYLVFIFHFIFQDRPSTKVRSVPGGDSSLGYLFGDKWCYNLLNSQPLRRDDYCTVGLDNKWNKGFNSQVLDLQAFY